MNIRRLPALLERDQLLSASALHVNGQHRSDAFAVVLVLQHVRFEGSRIFRLEAAVESPKRRLYVLIETKDFALVLRLALVILLAVRHAHLRAAGQENPRQGAVHSRLPRALSGDQ